MLRLDSIANKVGFVQRPFSPADLPQLRRLQLCELEVIGDVYLAEDIEQVAGGRALEKLKLRSVSATLKQIDAIRGRHPNVRIEATWAYNYWGLHYTPPPDHEALIAEVRLSRRRQNALPAFRCAANSQ